MIEPYSNEDQQQREDAQSRRPLFEAQLQQTNETQIGNTTEKEKENRGDMLKHIYDTLFRNKAAAWTAIFTCTLCVFSYLLWQVNDAANRLAVATQAPSVSSIGPILNKQPNPDGKTLKGWTIGFTWVNSRNTATKTAELQSNVYVGTASPGKSLDFGQLPQERIVTAVIAPHAGIQTPAQSFSLADMEDVIAGRKHMFFWGWAVYHDGFSKSPRLSEYCFNVEGAIFTKQDHGDFTGDATILNTPCGVHFCFDEDCEDYKDRTK